MSLRNLRSNAARFDNPVGSGHGAVKALYKRIVSRRVLNTFSYSPNFWFVINMTEGGFSVYNAGDTDPWTATGGAFPSSKQASKLVTGVFDCARLGTCVVSTN